LLLTAVPPVELCAIGANAPNRGYARTAFSPASRKETLVTNLAGWLSNDMAWTGAPEDWPDLELLRAIATHDQHACAVFYRRHLPRTVAYLMRETRDPELAADLAAEVFASVIVGARRYKPQTETAAPWLIGIARNVLANSRRRGRAQDRARRRLAMEPLELDDDDLERTESLAAQGMGPVAELVETLPVGERDAIKAHVLDEQSYREIAASLHCSEMVIRKRVSRGLARVRQRLEEGS
jgi:RNA polymerase sigma factor (sigma-70 family)